MIQAVKGDSLSRKVNWKYRMTIIIKDLLKKSIMKIHQVCMHLWNN